jgi:hypothetical protein
MEETTLKNERILCTTNSLPGKKKKKNFPSSVEGRFQFSWACPPLTLNFLYAWAWIANKEPSSFLVKYHSHISVMFDGPTEIDHGY